MKDTINGSRRLIIVSNRLPFNAAVEGGELCFHESSGGLVTGLSSYLESIGAKPGEISDYLWIGWPGATIDEQYRERLTAQSHERFKSHPVYLSEHEMENFYHGFCNKTVWPLFHYFPSYTSYSGEQWRMYSHVNEQFCNALLEVVSPRDVVWIHDYHLMLMPAMVKRRVPDLPVGFFLHIPFPSFELFRLLPDTWRKVILEGILGADLIGFHTHEYTQHFLQCVLRLLGMEHQMGSIILPDRRPRAETFPMGIEFNKFSSAVHDPAVAEERNKLSQSLAGLRVIVSVDRLDYSKGIVNRLQGYELLLETEPRFRGKVVLVMVVVPSRIGVEHYDLMKKQIEELVGKINGKFGSVGWTPVIYQYRHLSFAPLTALYSLSDVALVTPLRDGMNLVSKEYVATRSDERGVLILSEMAGAAKELGEAIIINPNDIHRIATALQDALDMPIEEQVTRNQAMRQRLERYNVIRWATDFITQLASTQEQFVGFRAKELHSPQRDLLIKEYKGSQSRLLLLDYDGTLSPLMPHPRLAIPRKSVLTLLQKLSSDPKNTLVLISGRDRNVLERWFGAIPLNIIAEHGVWVRKSGQPWALIREQVNGWKVKLLPILEQYTDRLPGAFIEDKEFSIAWHYRMADPEQAPLLERELVDHLTTFTANIDVQILRGSKVVELRNVGTNKGAAAAGWIAAVQPDFTLAVGDDWTDEELFGVLPETAYSIRVGVTNTRARFSLSDQADVIQLLTQLAVEGGGPV